MRAQASYTITVVKDGNDVDGITIQYIKTSSGATAPSQSDSGWSEEMPDFEAGKYVWTRNKVVFIDPSDPDTPIVTYTDPVLDTTWRKLDDLSTKYTEIKSTADEAYMKAGQNGEDIAVLKVTTEGLSSTVEGHGGRLTALDQKVDGISLKYTDSNGNETSFALTNGAIDITLLKDQIDDAATTATNFISLGSGGGIEVGNKSNGSWSGYRTQMTADAFNILDASNNVVATYGTDTIKLGLNSTTSKITFCGDSAKISYNSDADCIALQADDIGLYSTGDGTTSAYLKAYKEGDYGSGINLRAQYKTVSSSAWYYSEIDISSGAVQLVGNDFIGLYSPQVDVSGKISGQAAGGSWRLGRDNALLKSTSGTGTTAYFPVVDAKCNTGDWSIGTLGSDLYFVYTTDSDYGTGTNVTKKVRITSNGMLDALHGINIPNNTWLTIQNASGTDRRCIVMNASNQYFFGYSGLTQAEGASYFDGNAVYLRSNGIIQFNSYTGQGYGTILIGAQGTDRGLELRPATTNTCSLGWTSGRWKYAYVRQIYTTNSVSVDSDRRLKKDISYDFASIDKVIDSLNPAIYKLIADEDEKIRFGFVAQDVEQAFIEAGLNPDDYAFISKDETEDGVMLSLGYTETNALLWHRQQQLEKRIAELEKLTA